MRKVFIGLLMFMTTTMNISAQDLNLPGLTSPINVKVTDIGKISTYIDEEIVTDSLTGRQDTVYNVVPEVLWQSKNADFKNAQHSRRAISPWKIGGRVHELFAEVDCYVFKFTYESINSKGETVNLSGLAAFPNPAYTRVIKNMVIGTHITITSDKESPSNQTKASASDFGLLLSLAEGNPTSLKPALEVLKFTGKAALTFLTFGATSFLFEPEIKEDFAYTNSRYNFVVMPDYEGYGTTKDHAHPYLYEELTARQVLDGARAARYAYLHDTGFDDMRMSFRNDWRTVVCGYSQGGAVALSTHRYIEQNHLDEELHFAGSICGDGPYDPMSTLMYYVKNDIDGKPMSMPVVLPLIVKGMIDSNPYMRTHKPSDYFNPKFLETGILDWLTSKEKSTGDIEDAFQKLYKNGKGDDKNYYHDILESNGSAKMCNIMNKKCYDYFSEIYKKYKDKYKTAEGIPLPTNRGVMEDLHLALASNDVTQGWTPTHHTMLFHSTADTTVPYDNAERAKAKLGLWAVLHTSTLNHDHVAAGKDFFTGDENIEIVLKKNDFRVCFALRELIAVPYTGQKAGEITHW